MPQFMITYIGSGQPSSPEEGKKHYAKYQQWLASLGRSVVSPANPLTNSHTIKPDGSVVSESATTMSGYTIIKAGCMEDALDVAKACPFLEVGGSLEVSELIEMNN